MKIGFQALLILIAVGASGVVPCAFSAQTCTNKVYSAAGQWMKTANTNCLVWNSFPREGEGVTWSGPVLDGKAHGSGVVQWFTNGVPTTSYVGEMREGRAHGRGIAKGWGEELEGDWENVRLCTTNGTIRYAVGGWYKGEIIDGFKTGSGEELMQGDYKYVGQFKNDRFHGAGELLLPSGDKIAGQWADSKLQGIGRFFRTNGTSFDVRQTDKGIEPLAR
jgi:hypothetical protein